MKFTWTGAVVFLVLVIGYFAWIGSPLEITQDSTAAHRIWNAWFYSSLLYVVGAGTACFGEKELGYFPPTSLRWLFIIFGTLIMVASATWISSMMNEWREQIRREELRHPFGRELKSTEQRQ